MEVCILELCYTKRSVSYMAMYTFVTRPIFQSFDLQLIFTLHVLMSKVVVLFVVFLYRILVM